MYVYKDFVRFKCDFVLFQYPPDMFILSGLHPEIFRAQAFICPATEEYR
jgi:hypothetical protein